MRFNIKKNVESHPCFINGFFILKRERECKMPANNKKEISQEELWASLREEEENKIKHLSDLFLQQYDPYSFSPHFKKVTLKYFVTELHIDEIIDALQIAINKLPDRAEDALKYFCGICWNKIKYPNSLSIIKEK